MHQFQPLVLPVIISRETNQWTLILLFRKFQQLLFSMFHPKARRGALLFGIRLQQVEDMEITAPTAAPSGLDVALNAVLSVVASVMSPVAPSATLSTASASTRNANSAGAFQSPPVPRGAPPAYADVVQNVQPQNNQASSSPPPRFVPPVPLDHYHRQRILQWC